MCYKMRFPKDNISVACVRGHQRNLSNEHIFIQFSLTNTFIKNKIDKRSKRSKAII